MIYQSYTVKDFLLDERFRKWVMAPDPEVNAFWEEWLKNHPGKAQEAQKAREILQMIRFKEYHPADSDQAETWDKILKTIRDEERAQEESKVISMQALPGKRSGKRRNRFRYAAVLAGMLVTAALGFYLFKKMPVSHSTEYGEVKTIVLPDHSVVKLNAGSSIRYSRNWDKRKSREIWLSGEAFFSVVHKSDEQQFLVHTDDVTVQVTGTEFNVNTRHITTSVVLNNGSVRLLLNPAGDKVSSTGKPPGLLMKPGDMVSWSSRTGKLVTSQVDPELYSSWRANILRFKDTPVNEVIRSLEDHFGLSVRLEGPGIRDETFTGSIPLDNIEVFFKTLERSLDVEIIKKQEKVYIVRK